MLFSPPNEFGNQFLSRLVGYTCLVHISFLLLFFGVEAWLNSRPLVISLKGMGGKVSMLSRPQQRRGTKGRQARKRVPPKKRPVKKAVPAKKAAKKAPVKKTAAKKAAPKKTVKKTPVKKKVVPKKKTAPKKPVKKVPPKKEVAKKAPVKQNEKVAAAASVPQASQEKEIVASEVAVSSDALVREFAKHFTIPAGFEDYEPFTITFDIKNGRVINISPHTRGSLVVYTAVKDALLHSVMPYKDGKKISWRIT